MNGAELPCGSVLSVEPADSSYTQPRLDFYGSGGLAALVPRLDAPPPPLDPGPAVITDPMEQDEELDDFFNSI